MSSFAEQVDSLSWWPDRSNDWIDLVVRRHMATAQWKWAVQTHILRPEEPIYPVRYDVRASWNDPSHFDLATILWTVWPDLLLRRKIRNNPCHQDLQPSVQWHTTDGLQPSVQDGTPGTFSCEERRSTGRSMTSKTHNCSVRIRIGNNARNSKTM